MGGRGQNTVDTFLWMKRSMPILVKNVGCSLGCKGSDLICKYFPKHKNTSKFLQTPLDINNCFSSEVTRHLEHFMSAPTTSAAAAFSGFGLAPLLQLAEPCRWLVGGSV